MKVITNIFGEIDRLIEECKQYSKEPIHIELDCYDLAPLFKAIKNSGRVQLISRKNENSSWRPVDTVSDNVDKVADVWKALIDSRTDEETFTRNLNRFHVLMRDNKNYSLVFYKGADAFDRYPASYPIILNLE